MMDAREPQDPSAVQLAKGVREGRLRAVDLVEHAFIRSDAVGAGRDGLHTTLWEDRSWSRAEAAALDVAPDRRSRPMAGVPVMVKDNLATLHLPTSCGSRVLEGYVSPFEATAVARLRAAGAILVGKTNMDEFAMGSSTEHSAYGPTRNPHDRSRVPGGSSGGSAAAVAAGIVPVALGSETGGSVRQPAAFCGVVGIKPTYGRVSRYGLVAFASSLDHVGVFGRTVDDAAMGLEAIAGVDALDATSVNRPVPDFRRAKDQSLAGLVIGRPREYFPDGLHPGIRDHCDHALDRLQSLGAEVRDVSLPHTDLGIPVYYIVAPAEASSNLSRFDGARYGARHGDANLREMYEATRSRGFGAEVKRRILTPAFKIGAISDPYEMYLSDIFTVTANLTGVPAMSVPIGKVEGLPVGGQFMAASFDEQRMLVAAYALERALAAESRG